jgi:protein Mpv17
MLGLEQVAVLAALFIVPLDAWVVSPVTVSPRGVLRISHPHSSFTALRTTALFSSAAFPPDHHVTSSSSSTCVENTLEDNTASSTTIGTESARSTTESPLPFMTASPSSFVVSLDTKQVINGILLVVTFGWVAWTILTIDSGMTRGWTQSEIAMRIPVDNWSSYEMSLEQKPIYTKTMINVVIYLLGDWLSQTVFQGKNVLDFDAVRTLKNGFIGLCFGPLVHEYYQFSDHILPVDGPNSMINRIEKIFMDQTIYLSVKASIYVAAVSLLGGESWQQAQQNVKDRIVKICTTAWKFWPLVHCLTYTIIPAQHRILWVNCVDLVWNAILASISRANPDAKKSVVTVEEEENEPGLMVVRRQQQQLQLEDFYPVAEPAAPLHLSSNQTDVSVGTALVSATNATVA